MSDAKGDDNGTNRSTIIAFKGDSLFSMHVDLRLYRLLDGWVVVVVVVIVVVVVVFSW